MKRIAVLVSGGGTNLQALIDAQQRGNIPGGQICAVVSSRKNAYALERAAKAGIPGYTLPRREYDSNESYSRALQQLLQPLHIDLIVLGGFLCVLDEQFCAAYENRIINVHPSLIPSFCGDGMYGLHVHEAALAKGVRVTGATVHFVNAETDGGPIILQKAVEVLPGDTPEVLQQRVMAQAEHKLLPYAAALFCQDKLHVVDGKVCIDE